MKYISVGMEAAEERFVYSLQSDVLLYRKGTKAEIQIWLN